MEAGDIQTTTTAVEVGDPPNSTKTFYLLKKKIMLVFAPGTHVPAPPLPLTLSLFPAPSLSPQTERRKGN